MGKGGFVKFWHKSSVLCIPSHTWTMPYCPNHHRYNLCKDTFPSFLSLLLSFPPSFCLLLSCSSSSCPVLLTDTPHPVRPLCPSAPRPPLYTSNHLFTLCPCMNCLPFLLFTLQHITKSGFYHNSKLACFSKPSYDT